MQGLRAVPQQIRQIALVKQLAKTVIPLVWQALLLLMSGAAQGVLLWLHLAHILL